MFLVDSIKYMEFFSPEKKIALETEKDSCELEVSDRFWSLVQQRLGLPDVPKPGYVKIYFKSEHPRVNENIEPEKISSGENIVIQGVTDYNTMEIHFNIGPNDVDEDELAEVITHELIHCAQLEGEKYPEMKPPFSNDKEAPWEKEAYRLMKPLSKELLKNLDFNFAL